MSKWLRKDVGIKTPPDTPWGVKGARSKDLLGAKGDDRAQLGILSPTPQKGQPGPRPLLLTPGGPTSSLAFLSSPPSFNLPFPFLETDSDRASIQSAVISVQCV